MADIIKTRTEKGGVDLLVPDNFPQYYADGANHIAIGVPVSKIIFFSTSSVSVDDESADGVNIEKRKVAFEVSMPTGALFEFAKHVISNFNESKEDIDLGFKKYGASFKNRISTLEIIETRTKRE